MHQRLRTTTIYSLLLSLAVFSCVGCAKDSADDSSKPTESSAAAAGSTASAPMTGGQMALPSSTSSSGAASTGGSAVNGPGAATGAGGAGGAGTDKTDLGAGEGPGSAGGSGGAVAQPDNATTDSAGGGTNDDAAELDGGPPASLGDDSSMDSGTSAEDAAAGENAGENGPAQLPDPGTAGDGNFEIGPNYANQPELADQGAPKGQRFNFNMRLADSQIFDGTDSTLDPGKPVNQERRISVYVPARYEDGTPAPVMVIQDGEGPLSQVSNALDNLTNSEDPERRLPAFIAVAVQNGGNDAQGSERGLEYDTMSDRYARFIDEEVLPAVVSNAAISVAYPNLRFTTNPSGRATLGCSSGGAAAFTMAWFRPDLWSRVVAYSTTLVDQQNHAAPEYELYPHGAWDYHSELELIANSDEKPIRVFLNVNDMDLRANDPESTLHNWVMANDRTAEALAAQGYHYRYVKGLGAGHCDGKVQSATLADALVWVWRGYEPTAE